MEEKVVIFCISGQKRAGKDTVANYIKKFVMASRVSFADPVRDVCRAYFGWDEDWLLGEHKEDIDPYWGISPRQAMQYLGTEVGRVGIAENYPEFKSVTGDKIWIKNAQQKIRDLTDKEYVEKFGEFKAFVVPDMRFLNEYNAMKEMENEVYKVVTIGVRRGGLESDNHASETEIILVVEKCDYILDNNEGIIDLHKKVHDILINENVELKSDFMVDKQLEMNWNG